MDDAQFLRAINSVLGQMKDRSPSDHLEQLAGEVWRRLVASMRDQKAPAGVEVRDGLVRIDGTEFACRLTGAQLAAEVLVAGASGVAAHAYSTSPNGTRNQLRRFADWAERHGDAGRRLAARVRSIEVTTENVARLK